MHSRLRSNAVQIPADMLTFCGYCRKPFKKDQQVYIKSAGWLSWVIFDEKCREKYHADKKIVDAQKKGSIDGHQAG